MHAPAPKTGHQYATSGVPWSAVVAALLAGVGALVLVSWVGTHLVV
ncbi:MAG: hypothetical protein U5L06_10920 [Rhodovibrio sp.]|nr:hypothetical protein [Rhodovibrio sp.]